MASILRSYYQTLKERGGGNAVVGGYLMTICEIQLPWVKSYDIRISVGGSL